MVLTYKALEQSDIQVLTPIMKEAFDTDTKMHTDLKEDGPNGYDNGELLKKMLYLDNAESKVIYIDGIVLGGYAIIKNKNVYTLNLLFIDPVYASKGIGTKVWMDIEKEYTEAKTWVLETPDYSKRNHHFYEKCGFKKMEDHLFENKDKSIRFIKHCMD